MNRLSRLSLIFAVAFAFFIVSPAFLSSQFSGYTLIKNGDVLDILTPLFLIPLYWALFQLKKDGAPTTKETIAFLVLAAFWVEGQGMHLGANSIGHLIKDRPELTGGNIDTLTNFYDEFLSHYLWHIGLVGLAGLILYRQWHNPFLGEKSSLRLPIIAGIIHGFNFFLTIVEARTAPLGVPFAVAVTLFVLMRGRDKLREQPLLTFFFVTSVVATIFFAGWALYWGGLPEFSAVGIID